MKKLGVKLKYVASGKQSAGAKASTPKQGALRPSESHRLGRLKMWMAKQRNPSQSGPIEVAKFHPKHKARLQRHSERRRLRTSLRAGRPGEVVVGRRAARRACERVWTLAASTRPQDQVEAGGRPESDPSGRSGGAPRQAGQGGAPR